MKKERKKERTERKKERNREKKKRERMRKADENVLGKSTKILLFSSSFCPIFERPFYACF